MRGIARSNGRRGVNPTMGIAAATLPGFATIVGEDRVITDPAVLRGYAVEGCEPRSAVYPRSEEEVAAVLKLADEQDLAVIPCRNATKLHLGNLPRRYDVALCVKEMNQVWHYEPADLTVSVEPGMKLGDFQHFLARHRLWIPLDPPGGAKSSLGGIVATNAAGPLRLRYGTPRDMVIGMKIATTGGKLVKTGGHVVKNVAGYDLAKLLIGSYGTLGVIVEISFKLFPLPERQATLVFDVPGIEAAREFRRRVLASPLTPIRMVFLDPGASAFARGESEASRESGGFEIWVEFGGSGRVIERSLRTVQEIAHAAGAQARAIENHDVEEGWNRISDPGATLAAAVPQLLVLKAALPIASSEEFVQFAQQEAQKRSLRLACFCQNGVGVIHVCLMSESSLLPEADLVETLRRVAVTQGGSLVVERCPAAMMKKIDVWGPTGDDWGVMRKLKELWDPKGTLSPGRFVGGL